MIRTYTNTKAEYNVAKARFEYLMSLKEELYTKYFSISAKYSDDVSHTNKATDKMADYMNELLKVNPATGMSLDKEIEEARNKLGTLRYYLNRMEHELQTTTGIENELFRKIVFQDYRPTKAVEIIAEKYNLEPITIWKRHYPKIKKEILKCIVKV